MSTTSTMQPKQQIEGVIDCIRDVSFKQRIKSKEERINDFLDAILDVKQELTKQTSTLNNLTSKIEELTWLDDKIDEESFKLLNELLVLTNDIHYTMIKDEYVPINNIFRPNGIAVEELKNFKFALNDFKEARQDLESTFFGLLKNPDFLETTKKLATLLV